jgi:hypothetical protein
MEEYPESLMDLLEHWFATEDACREHLCRLRWPEGVRCPVCGHGEAWTLEGWVVQVQAQDIGDCWNDLRGDAQAAGRVVPCHLVGDEPERRSVKKAAQAIHVIDRFHIMGHMSNAIDEVRAQEAKKPKAEGYEPVLKSSGWLQLKRAENLSEKQETRLAQLLQYNPKTLRAYLLRAAFQCLWGYITRYWRANSWTAGVRRPCARASSL